MAGKKISSYNDGIAKIYQKKDMKKNVKGLEDLVYLGFLYFEERSKRQQDIEFAEQLGSTLSMKITTPDSGKVDASYNVVIENVIYAIIHIDRDVKKGELYLYLEEVRKIERKD